MVKSIDEILKRPFSSRTTDDQLKVILEGKPRPELTIFSATQAEDGGNFDMSCYDKETWLTACDQRNTFYCWSCLLFARESESIWTTQGFDDYVRLYEAMSQHNMATDHIGATLQLQMFVFKNISKVVTLNIAPQPDESVQNSQQLMKRILDLVCNIASSFPREAGCNVKLHEYVKETCTEALILSQSYSKDPAVDKAVDLLKSTKFISDVFSSLSNMVKTKIKMEIQSSQYVSLVLSEHSDVSPDSKISFVLRYAKDGKVRENFIGFICDKVPKSADTVQTFMSDVISGYGMEQKCIAFSCDGALLPACELRNLASKLKLSKPCFLVPCYFHHFGVVLEQSMSQYSQGASFFKTLSSIRRYLQSTRKMRGAFGSNDFDLIPTNWSFAKSVKQHRRQMVNFFKSVVHNPGEWDDDDVTNAMGYYKTLEEFETIFMLEIIYAVSEHIDELCYILNGDSPEDLFENQRLSCFVARLSNVGLKDFPYVWKQSCVQIGELDADLSSVQQISEDLIGSGVRETCRQLFEKIMINVTEEIEVRFASGELLRFFQLLNGENQRKFGTPDYIRILMRAFWSEFDEVQLIKELKAVEALINEKSAHEILEILSAENLKVMLQNVRKLAEIVLSMPLKAACARENSINRDVYTNLAGASEKPNTTKFDLIKSWSTLISPNDAIANDWSVIFVEQDILKHLMSQKQFFSEFLCTFRTRNAALKLI